MFTLHNLRSIDDFYTRNTIRLSNKVIFVSDPGNLPGKGIICHAYLPPVQQIPIPEKLLNELSRYKNILVSMSTSSGKRMPENDVYGFDLILDALGKNSFGNETVLVLCDPSGKSKELYREKIASLFKQKLIQVIHVDEEVDFSLLLKKASLYIRATRSDGDSLAVREALDAGTRVLASDCVKRPAGCKVFRNGSNTDLSEKISATLAESPARYYQPECFSLLKEVYDTL